MGSDPKSKEEHRTKKMKKNKRKGVSPSPSSSSSSQDERGERKRLRRTTLDNKGSKTHNNNKSSKTNKHKSHRSSKHHSSSSEMSYGDLVMKPPPQPYNFEKSSVRPVVTVVAAPGDNTDTEMKSEEKRKSKHHKHDRHSKLVFQELSSDDYFSKNNEFATWLKEDKDLFFSDLSSESARDLFSQFVEVWNKQKLEYRYYEGITTAPRTSHKWRIK